MFYIGDVHGDFLEYNEIIKTLPCSIQLGDMGIGFGKDHLFSVSKNHRWIRGNHDNRSKCELYSNYLGDFGYLKEEEIFFISGGFSIDCMYRIEGVSWWPDEELSLEMQQRVVDLYEKIKPRIVISHEAPKYICQYMSGEYEKFKPSSTSSLLNHLLTIHSPEYWIFGHWHRTVGCNLRGVKFQCVDSLDVVEIK